MELEDIKLRLKKWERSFTLSHDRKPSKTDVPDEMLALYRQYSALKHRENAVSVSNTQPNSHKGSSNASGGASGGGAVASRHRRSLWNLPSQLGIRRRGSFADVPGSRSLVHLQATPQPTTQDEAPPSAPTTPPDSPHPPTVSSSLQPRPPTTPPRPPSLPTHAPSPATTPEPHPPPATPLTMPGHCTFKSSRLKFGTVSRDWLGSCKAELLDERGVSLHKNKENHTADHGQEQASGVSVDTVPVRGEVEGEGCSGLGDGREESAEVTEEEGGDRSAVKRRRPTEAEDSPPLTKSRGGNVSENFVKLNMKVKRYSRRPGRALTGSAHKRAEWKKRQKGSETRGRGKGAGGRFVCYKCGKTGHWARNCRERGAATSLGSFAGQAVQFSEAVALGLEEEGMDQETLEELERECPFPTVSEAAAMVGKSSEGGTRSGERSEGARAGGDSEGGGGGGGGGASMLPGEDSGGETPVASSAGAQLNPLPNPAPSPMEPLFAMEQGSIISAPPSVLSALKKLGFAQFRPGQKEAVMRVLSGVSTLLVTGTGSGKSLCYQLPAHLYRETRPPCVTLVVSPLVSLMDDQVQRFPPGVRGACLHTGQTHPQRERALREVVEGKVDVLLLSPEALVGGALWRRGRGSGWSLHDLPPVAFACIDEVHCISEWSHNFRPSYLQVYKVLRERFGVHCVLGLTATATHATGLSVARHLGVASKDIIRGPTLPNNLRITVSCDRDRDQALIELLSREPFTDLQSIIVYCTRQQTAETLAVMLRTNFQTWDNQYHQDAEETDSNTSIPVSSGSRRRAQGRGSKRRKGVVFAECYHAGMSAAKRRSVQNRFMSGGVRVVVATVAFGMGLNKSDVRAIVHYNMPKSVESYVQEIGRAGRDGSPAHCHVFIDKEGSDLYELYRHAHGNGVDPYAIKKLVELALPLSQPSRSSSSSSTGATSEQAPLSSSSGSNPPETSGGHEVAIPIETTVQRLDASEESLSTLLCYMELQGWLEVRPPIYDTCTLKCYGGARQLKALARKVPAIAAAAARLREKGVDLDGSSHMQFSVVGTAAHMGWDSAALRSEVLGLRHNDRGTCPSTTPSPRGSVLVEMEELAFHVITRCPVTRELQDCVIRTLADRVAEQVRAEVRKVQILHAVLRSAATDTHNDIVESDGTLRGIIGRYFDHEGLSVSDLTSKGIPVLSCQSELSPEEEDLIGRDVVALATRFSDQCFSGRAVARIFQGISSPRYPAMVWGAQRAFWRKYLHMDFNTLCHLATRKLLDCR